MTILLGDSTDAGTDVAVGANGEVRAVPMVAAASGTIATVSFKLTAYNSGTRLALYANSAGAPGALLGWVAVPSGVALNQVVSIAFPAVSIVSGTTYWIADQGETAASRITRGTTPASVDLNFDNTSGWGAAPPDPFVKDSGVSSTTRLIYFEGSSVGTFPYTNTVHGEPHELSALFGAQLATVQPYDLRIASDTDPAVMTVDWAQIDTDGAWLNDITPYVTLASGVEGGTAAATLEIYLHETDTVESRIVTIEDLGPNGTVTIDSIDATKNAATINYSYDRADLTGFEYSLDDGATTVATSNPAELTTLTQNTPYNFWIRAINASGPGVWTKDSFTTAAGVDTTPNAFSFTAQTNVPRSDIATSNSITVQGVDAATDVPISVAGDPGSEYRYSSNGGTSWSNWTAVAGNVRLNYLVQARHNTSPDFSSGGYDGVRETSITIGGVTGTFTSTTLADTVKPVITLTDGNINWTQGTPWVDPGYSATDNSGETLTVSAESPDVNVLGPQTINYSTTDLSGNTGTASRTVTVVEVGQSDAVAPVISLVDGNQTITEGVAWSEPGYTATDNVDGDITADVVVTGTVNVNQPGTYLITYSVTDAAGNTGTATRTVTVVSAVEFPATTPAPSSRTYVVERTHRPELGESVFTLRDNEILDFDFDLTAWLAEQSDTLQASGGFTVTIPDNSIALKNGARITGLDRIKVWLDHNDAAAGKAYPVRLTATTANNRTAVFQFRVVALDPYQ